ncbi:hypothetical protein PTI45_03291 [Paenibacillus nuruki]|uniref:AtpZ/AtpI family protein n=1 Tax=Paenibacillus nuruki TaxID=1886670 RepID=A0A1E3L0N7_9BACL|nr:AtpZ/AtpI family protein [Paenibacillus nuruki]ODP27357.1 hypothetical protein PTI45_03291 [Paenibacillus nuruki]
MADEPKSSNSSSNPWKAVGLVSVIGIDLAVCTLAGFWFGSWLDKVWNSSGIGTGLGVLAGMILGIFGIVLIIKKIVGETNE